MTMAAAALLYRERCPRCRFIARALWLITLAGLRLEPMDSPAANQLASLTRSRAKLLIRSRNRIRIGRRAVVAFFLAALPRWLALIAAIAALVRI